MSHTPNEQLLRLETIMKPIKELTDEGKEVALLGDLNIDLLETNDPRSNYKIKTLQDNYLPILDETQMCQLNFKPTRYRINCNAS